MNRKDKRLGYDFDVSKLRSGDIIGFATRKFQIYGTPIQGLTKSKFNHVGGALHREIIEKYLQEHPFIVETKKRVLKENPIRDILLNNPDEQWFVAEALMSGYQLNPLSPYLTSMLNRDNDIQIKRLSPSHFKTRYECEKRKQTAIKRRLDWVSEKKPYDTRAIIGFATNAIVKVFLRKLGFKNNWLNDKDEIFCSESECEAHYLEGDEVTIFVGKHDKKATCATLSPGDIMRSDKLFFVTGKKDLK